MWCLRRLFISKLFSPLFTQAALLHSTDITAADIGPYRMCVKTESQKGNGFWNMDNSILQQLYTTEMHADFYASVFLHQSMRKLT